ncbi:MAG: LamG domain-containing protein [Verrucomicrobiales bacterium]|nr:LamG domain-containing protein [Verrucomicrobiales bacterium]
MKPTSTLPGFALLTAAWMAFVPIASAASPLIAFEFDEGSGTRVTDSVNSLSGGPGNPANPPTFVTDAPSGKPGDTAVAFAAGQYFTVDDPDTRVQLDPANPSFTLQAWVKFAGLPAGRMVFFYSNGPGGALSFSVNNDRTVFVTTLGIADVRSQAAIPDDDAWHHIAVVHEPGLELRFYVDGVLGDTVPYTSGVNFTRTQKLFSIGAEWNGALQYVGSVDRLKVHSGMLTPEELDAQAAPPTPLVAFEFDEGEGTRVTDSINSLSGVPGSPANPPTFEAAAPSGQAGDTAVHFESGQYFTVDDPDTRIQFNPSNPHFTLQAWVKVSGSPAGRMVFFYSNGPGGAVSFSVNNDRTVFVTTLGIADVRSQAAIPDDEDWHHIAVVHEAGLELRFYVDGVLGDTVPYTGGVNFTRTQKLFSIGAEWNGALQYVGSVDRLKVHSGMLTPEQLDAQKVPPAGADALVIGRASLTPFSYSVGVNEVGGSVVDPDTIALTFDGTAVTPTAVSKRGRTTTITYDIPNPPLASGSSHTANLTVKDRKGTAYTSTSSFVVATYGTLPASAALPASAVDLTKKGFKIRTYQIEVSTQEGTIAYNEDLLAGLLGDNIAWLDDAGGVDANGYFTWTDVINFDTTTAANGYFNDPEYPNVNFPGIPGLWGTVDNFALETVAALEFKTTGMYSMAVNTDWTGFPNFSDGYQVRAGTAPLDPAASVVLGFFDALAPAGPTRGLANTPFQFYVPKPGIYPFRLLYYQTAGTANLEWFILNPDGTRTLINDAAKADAIAAYYQWTTPPAAPALSVARTTGGVSVTFEGTLQAADQVAGAYTDVAGATSPYVTPASAPMKFYRARR